MRSSLLILSLLLIRTAAVFGQSVPPVPPQYQSLASSLQTQLSSFTQTIHANWNGSRSNVIYSAQLLSASTDLGDALIGPNHISGVQRELQELQALGVTAVTVHINFPYLSPAFQSPTELQQYQSFYQLAASEIHGRGLKLIVETQVAKGLTSAASSYVRNLSWTNYQNGRAQLAVSIARLMLPEYITVISEPDTEAAMSGQSSAGTLQGSTQMLTTILNAIHAAGISGVQVGAGTGTWQSNFTGFMNAFVAQPVQFLDIHVYAVNKSFLPNAMTAADIAHAAGKPITMSEAWLEKAADNELGPLSTGTVMNRNWSSYWTPLDSQFLQAMVMLANYKQFAFISPFWSYNLFAYADPSIANPTLPNESQAALTALGKGQFTGTGLAYERALLLTPDVTVPQIPVPPTFSRTLNALHLSWNATTDNIGVAGYNVYRNGQFIGATYSTTFADSTAIPGTTNTYTLSAFDAAGNISRQSAGVQANWK